MLTAAVSKMIEKICELFKVVYYLSVDGFEYCMYGIELRGNGNKCQLSLTLNEMPARLTFVGALFSAARFRLLRAAPLSILALPLARRVAVRR